MLRTGSSNNCYTLLWIASRSERYVPKRVCGAQTVVGRPRCRGLGKAQPILIDTDPKTISIDPDAA